MSTLSRTGRFVLGAAGLLLVSALAAWLAPGAATPARAASGEGKVAGSVCEAHELRALKEADPHANVEIPPEFDKPWPSASACASEAAARDVAAPGPVQPIPFSHKHHAGQFGIDCQYCHSGTDRSRAAGVPSVELCMGCHGQFPAEYDELEGIRTLKKHWGVEVVQEDGQWKSQQRDPDQAKPIEWQQIHRLPEYVKFRHNRHVSAGLECQRCHGPVEKLDKLYLVPDTIWWPWMMPAQKLEMGWCIECHRQNDQQASQDCLTCHY